MLCCQAMYFGHAGTLLKLTVAATFVIELPATALILAPWRPLRMIGAALQAFLQVGGATTCFSAPAPAHDPAQACLPAETGVSVIVASSSGLSHQFTGASVPLNPRGVRNRDRSCHLLILSCSCKPWL